MIHGPKKVPHGEDDPIGTTFMEWWRQMYDAGNVGLADGHWEAIQVRSPRANDDRFLSKALVDAYSRTQYCPEPDPEPVFEFKDEFKGEGLPCVYTCGYCGARMGIENVTSHGCPRRCRSTETRRHVISLGGLRLTVKEDYRRTIKIEEEEER